MTPVTTEPPRDPSAFEFVIGRWENQRSQESWTRVGDVLVGVAFSKMGGFEVLTVDAHQGFLGYTARPQGGAPTTFGCSSVEGTAATFTNPAHDSPQRIRYERDGDRMTAAIGPVVGDDLASWRWKAVDRVALPEVEAAERAFAASVLVGGVDAWLAAFAPDGWMWNDGPVKPGPAMRELMEGRLSSGKLTWDPVTSGRSPYDEDLAFTIGTWTHQANDGGSLDGWYATVWRQDATGAWKVWYDVGDTTGP